MLQTNSQIQQDGRMILSAIRRHWDSRQGTLYAFVSDFLTLCRILMDQPRFFVASHRKFPAPDTRLFFAFEPQNLPCPVPDPGKSENESIALISPLQIHRKKRYFVGIKFVSPPSNSLEIFPETGTICRWERDWRVEMNFVRKGV